MPSLAVVVGSAIICGGAIIVTYGVGMAARREVRCAAYVRKDAEIRYSLFPMPPVIERRCNSGGCRVRWRRRIHVSVMTGAGAGFYATKYFTLSTFIAADSQRHHDASRRSSAGHFGWAWRSQIMSVIQQRKCHCTMT